MTDPVGLYIHIPFCDAKCSYCDFVTFTDRHSQIDLYLQALLKELDSYKGWPLQTIFIGGGTPTVLSPAQINSLLSAIHTTFDCSGLLEATVEANPESATIDKLAAFRDGGIDRISFGLQTTKDPLLKTLGRLHDRAKFFSVFESARAIGYDNINVDLMFGLPGQTPTDWTDTLSEIAELAPEHISAYALKVEQGTKLAKQGFEVNSDSEADMYLAASDYLQKRGYEHYEISNFSKPGKEAKHNLLYWENKNTVGAGISSASHLSGRRFKNTSRLQNYIDSMLNGRPVVEEDSTLEADEKQKESVMLALRLKRGVDAAMLRDFDLPMTQTFLDRGLAVSAKGMYSLTPKGWLLSNMLFQQFV